MPDLPDLSPVAGNVPHEKSRAIMGIRKGFMEIIDSKIERLRLLLSEMSGVIIGYSGGKLRISSRS
jgi:hypothetical protein